MDSSRDRLRPVLSHYQATPLLAYRDREPQSLPISFDLGQSLTDVTLSEAGLTLPGGQGAVSWELLGKISDSENSVFQIIDGELVKVQAYSETLERSYSLLPTGSAPTMLVSGITMHRIVDCDPWLDTRNKIKALGRPPTGAVLDTTMGLGYTAIQAAATAATVTTIEIDPTVVEICRANPWSQPLFSDQTIERQIGHAWDVMEPMAAARFSTIVHDPPMFNMAGELYSTDFYRECYRLLKPKGRLFHYIGNPKSRSGATTTRGVVKRLKEAGFRKVVGREDAFGVLALK